MNAITFQNVVKKYGSVEVLRGVSFDANAGEMFGFIGPNGAGKSTTIRFLATLLRATAGEGTVNGHSVTQDPIGVRKSVGYMPDNFGVYDGMKVWEFLDFFAVAYQIPRSRRKAIIGDVLEPLTRCFAIDLGAELPTNDNWTYFHPVRNSYARPDRILVSPALTARCSALTIWREGISRAATAYDGPRLDDVGQIRPRASEHALLTVDLAV